MSLGAQFWIIVGVLTLVFEGTTCLFRFGFGLRSRDYKFITGGVRVHHGYVGGSLCLGVFILPLGYLTLWTAALGAALILSDLIHHFVVMPIAIGKLE